MDLSGFFNKMFLFLNIFVGINCIVFIWLFGEEKCVLKLLCWLVSGEIEINLIFPEGMEEVPNFVLSRWLVSTFSIKYYGNKLYMEDTFLTYIIN